MDAADFQNDDNWVGGYYELAIDLGPVTEPPSTDRLQRALVATWDDDRLDGCYLDRWQRRESQDRVAPALTGDQHPSPLYGTAQLPSGRRVVCVTHIVRGLPEHGPDAHDWLSLCLPIGALGLADSRIGGFPAEQPDTSTEWRRPIDDWLVAVAERVYATAQFESAQVDWEVAGIGLADDLSRHQGTYLLPGPRELTVHRAKI